MRWAAAVLLVASSAAAETYTVAKDGDDAGPGTRKHPWQTLQHAADQVMAGDTVTVQPGTYTGFQLRHRGKPGAVISFVGIDASIEGDNGTTPDGVDFAGVAYAELGGFAIRRASRDGVRVEQSDHVYVANVTIEDVGQAGITVLDSHAVRIGGAHVARTGTSGIALEGGSELVVQASTVTGAKGAGIAVGAGAELEGVIVSGGAGDGIDCAGPARVVSSLVFGNAAFGVLVASSAVTLVHDTIIATGGQYAVKLDARGASLVENILLAQMGGGAIWAAPGAFPFASDRNAITPLFALDRHLALDLGQWRLQTKQDGASIAADLSLFVDAAHDNYRLAPGSAAIDKGASTSLGPIDLEGNRRVVHGRPDLGAYEACSTDCAPLAPVARDARGCCDGGGGGSLLAAVFAFPLLRRRRC